MRGGIDRFDTEVRGRFIRGHQQAAEGPIEIKLQEDYPPIEQRQRVKWWRWQLVRDGKILGSGWMRNREDAKQSAKRQLDQITRNLCAVADKAGRVQAHTHIIKTARSRAGEASS